MGNMFFKHSKSLCLGEKGLVRTCSDCKTPLEWETNLPLILITVTTEANHL